jgi:hypothetical protein
MVPLNLETLLSRQVVAPQTGVAKFEHLSSFHPNALAEKFCDLRCLMKRPPFGGTPPVRQACYSLLLIVPSFIKQS